MCTERQTKSAAHINMRKLIAASAMRVGSIITGFFLRSVGFGRQREEVMSFYVTQLRKCDSDVSEVTHHTAVQMLRVTAQSVGAMRWPDIDRDSRDQGIVITQMHSSSPPVVRNLVFGFE